MTAKAAVSESFMEAYFKQRAYDLSPEGRQVLSLAPETFFRLGPLVDWAQENRNAISLDRLLPPLPLEDPQPATFVLSHLQRMLVIDAKGYQFKEHDGLDFCHAVLAAAYGSLITLDKHWKRRIDTLPCADRLARTYYRPELDDLVSVLESVVKQ